ncbi:MAG TPA: hypothetical protein DCR46_04315, partial [Cytophagales bacterium]|nr:hypothetical protein [Cytophagales bacterium]
MALKILEKDNCMNKMLKKYTVIACSLRKLILLIIFFTSILSYSGYAQSCNPAWDASAVYATPTSVSFNGRNYTSKYWTQGNQPGDPWGAWTDNGACTSCNTVNAGSIGSAQLISSNTAPSPLTSISAASGGNGSSYAYQWQSSTNNSTWTDISGANSSTYTPGVLSTRTYFRRKATSGACGEGVTSAVLVRIIGDCVGDNDNDGVCDADDLDDDNDGILDVTECPAGNFQWSTPPTVVSTNTATGTIHGFINYTYTSDQPVQTETVFQNVYSFPTKYNLVEQKNIMNTNASSNNIVFSQPVTDPILAFGSIGAGGFPVGVTFSNPIEVLWSENVTQDSPTQITGSEGQAIIKLKGVFTQFSFNYLVTEFRVNFQFGSDFTNDCDIDNDGITNSFDLDSDGDGCPDAIEGGAAFNNTDLSGQVLAGNVDANGLPIKAGGSGQTVGSSQNVNVLDVSCPKPCTLDTDNDGVCDIDDLDNDNDGILDEVECPSNLVSTNFSSTNGATVSFNAPAADEGFQLDIFNLDNSFNLNINGTLLVPNELQFTPTGVFTAYKPGQSVAVFESDLSPYSENGIQHIHEIIGNAANPVVRLIFNKNGTISLFGKRTLTSPFEKMIIKNTDPQFNNVIWKTSGTNQIILSQLVYGGTFIEGLGSGIQKCTNDSDSDGKINSLDIDSDGDGCADAIEGGGAFKSSDLNGQVLADAVDANGIPIKAGVSGQTVGTSADNNLKDAECCTKPIVSVSDSKVCKGATITASPTTAGTWVSSNPSIATISNAGVITGVSAGTATFAFTNATGCTNTTNAIIVNVLPTVVANGIALCTGESKTLTATGATTYTWSPSTDLSASTGASVTANPSITTVYTVEGTDA